MAVVELTAPPSWQAVDFISDLHLNANEPATVDAWQSYMLASTAGALFILGDLFEVWVGDDAIAVSGFESQCARIIRQAALRMPIFFMRGNRDFLAGQALMQACNMSLLADPTVLTFNHQHWLLAHGDALCVDDVDYLAFRQQVRSAQWQHAFLAKPLAERQAIARGLRQQSQAQHDLRKQSGVADADVDAGAARQLLTEANANTLIHGHTHKPADIDLGDGLQRVVLSDWDAQATPARVEVLRLTTTGLRRLPLLDEPNR